MMLSGSALSMLYVCSKHPRSLRRRHSPDKGPNDLIARATYEKWEHGHLPRELLMAQRDLETNERIATETVDFFGKKLKQVTALGDPDMSGFSEDELAVIEGAIRRYGHESASYLSELSHQEVGWRLAELKGNHPVPDRVSGRGRGQCRRHPSGEELASLHGWN
jgi:hypothetical protein